MKKLFLLLIVLLLSLNIYSQVGYYSYFYVKCPGQAPKPVGSGISFGPGAAGMNSDNCWNMCATCKLQVLLVKHHANGSASPIDLTSSEYNPSLNTAKVTDKNNNITNSTISVVNDVNPDGVNITLYEIDLSYLNNITDLGEIRFQTNKNSSGGFNEQAIFFKCTKVIPANNKDKFDLKPISICKNDCIYMYQIFGADLFSSYTKVKSIGCIGDPDYKEGSDLTHDYRCYSNTGVYNLCLTIEDECGKKDLSTTVEVKDCKNEDVNCFECCDLVKNIVIFYDPVTKTYSTSMPIPKSCGKWHWEITYQNGNVSNVYSNTFTYLGNDIYKICFKFDGCSACNTNSCLMVSGSDLDPDCIKCCNWLSNQNVAFSYDPVFNSVSIPSLLNQGCKSGKLVITFSDNSTASVNVTGNYTGVFLKKVKKICYISDCPSCPQNCIDIE